MEGNPTEQKSSDWLLADFPDTFKWQETRNINAAGMDENHKPIPLGYTVKGNNFNEESLIQKEQIVFYQNDYSVFYEPSEKTKQMSPLSKEFADEIFSKNINTLITGTISRYADYLSVKVEVILYPNAKVIGSFLEIGSIDDLDFITSSLASQIVPVLTNSMPVKVNVRINPLELKNITKIYIDDVLFNSNESFILESGVHNVQFVAENYQTIGTDYYFEGNKQYFIEASLKEKKNGQITLALVHFALLFGDIFVNLPEFFRLIFSRVLLIFRNHFSQKLHRFDSF